jgi:AraC-like DNA-binding protein
MCILVLLSVLTSWIIHTFSEEIKDLNYNLTSIVQRSVDIRLEDINDFSTQLQLNNINLKISNCTDIDKIKTSDIFLFRQQLIDFKLSNTFVDGIFIYYPNLDYIIGDLGDFRSKQYYLLNNNLKYEGYKAWLENILTKKNGEFSFQEGTEGELDLYSSKQLPYGDINKKAILVIKIKKEEVLKILSQEEVTAPNSLTAIVSDDNKVYTYSGNEDYMHLLNNLTEQDYAKAVIRLDDYWGSNRASDFFGMKYVTLINQKDILESTYYIRNITYVSLIFCMLFGIGLFAIMSRRNNRPVAKLMEKFHEKLQGSEHRFVDEYSFINNNIDDMLEDKQKNLEKLGEQRELIEGLFLSNLLCSEERNNSVIFASIQRYNLQLDYSLFQIILIKGMGDFDRQESHNIISRIVDEIKKMHLELYVIATEYAGDLVLLFNMDYHFTVTKMVEILEELRPHVKEGCSFILGGIYDTMSHIVTSYHQALTVAETKETSSSGIYIYDLNTSNKPLFANQAPGFMAEYEIDMLDGNYEEAQKKIDLLFNHYIAADKHSFTSRCKKYAVINPLIEVMIKIAKVQEDYNADAYFSQLSSIKDNKELLRFMHTIFDEIIIRTNQNQLNQKEGIAEKAKEYINHNFENPMLGLYVISEYLGVSNTYLSTIFKKNYDIGITQYINKLRIEKSKRLIMNTDYSIKDIALNVGFSSDVTFIRVFKQFENITPGKFKEN